jgi:hypothetical protein
MKKTRSRISSAEGTDELRTEYDFRSGVRGKHYRAYRQGYKVTIHKADGTTEVCSYKPEEGMVRLEPDVRKYFPDADSVNQALRSLIALIPQKPRKVRSRRA